LKTLELIMAKKRRRTISLTPRDLEVINLSKHGKPNWWVADKLCLSVPGVKFHNTQIYRCLGIKSGKELLAIIASLGLKEGQIIAAVRGDDKDYLFASNPTFIAGDGIERPVNAIYGRKVIKRER
jgi:DNA-binding CsgD family transcriptional regulator